MQNNTCVCTCIKFKLCFKANLQTHGLLQMLFVAWDILRLAISSSAVYAKAYPYAFTYTEIMYESVHSQKEDVYVTI